jgi:dihydroorotate dehydrogenase (fumarate)
MNLSTKYLGLTLKNPLMPGASPMVDNLDNVRRLEDAGAAAIVLRSLFAEQIEGNEIAVNKHIDRWQDNFAEATSFFPNHDDFSFGPDEYLGRIGDVKKATSLPVIASLNGTNTGTWIDYARQIEAAGADALELNTYFMATSSAVTSSTLEQRVVSIVSGVRKAVKIPVAVKLSPFYTNVANLAVRLEEEGAQGVVLFNRFFQPEIDIENLEVTTKLDLSTSEDLRLRLRWLGLMRDQVKMSLACSGGVHNSADVAKALLAGADAVQVTAELLSRGPGRVAELLVGLKEFMAKHEYESVSEVVGALSLRNCPDPEAYERGNYLRMLQLWKE